MATPVRRNITIRTGDVYREHFAFITSVGRYLTDLSITDGSTGVTGVFSDSDNGKIITVVDGSGITDGTTLSAASSSGATLSAAADEDREGVFATISPADLSGYTGHLAQIKAYKGSADVLATLTVTTSRANVGIVTFSLSETDTATLTENAVWDWQCTGPYGTVTLAEGKVTVDKDVSQ